jgi:hypothetical protein
MKMNVAFIRELSNYMLLLGSACIAIWLTFQNLLFPIAILFIGGILLIIEKALEGKQNEAKSV